MSVKSRLKLDDSQVSHMIDLYNDGWFMRDLAKKFNISNVSVSNYLKRNNVTKRNRNEEISRFAKTRIGDKNSFWSGGRTKRSDGYILIRISKNTRVLEHRYLMEKHIGRPLKRNEHVHHINNVKDDNRIENLKLMTASEHNKLTGLERIGNREIKHYVHVEKEDFKDVIISCKSVKEVCKYYDFSSRTFYNKLKKLELESWYKNWRKEA